MDQYSPTEITQLKYASKRKSHNPSNHVDVKCEIHSSSSSTPIVNECESISANPVCASPEYENSFCTDNYDKSDIKTPSTLNYSQETSCSQLISTNASSTRKRRRVHSPSTNIPTQVPPKFNVQSSISKTNHRLSIASIPSTVDINNPKKGDIIQMENGSRKKFDGVVWRKICSIPHCLIAAQRDDLCRKHYIKINGKPNQESPNVAKFQSTDEKQKSQTMQKLKDESMDYDQQDFIDDNKSTNYHTPDDDAQINQENCSITPEDNIDIQIDHTLLNALSACRQKFLTNHLKNWLREHHQNPYPTNQEKLQLAKQSHVTYDHVVTWFNNARDILQSHDTEKQQSHDDNSSNENSNACDSSHDISYRIQQSLPLFTGLCSRSIGIQCDTSTINEQTSTSTSTMIDEELLLDRRIKIIKPSSHLFQHNTSEKSLNNSNQTEQIVIASTCLDDDQMVRLNEFSCRFNIKLSNTIDENTTHLITNEIDEKLVCSLSKKVIQAIARHLYVLTYRWIDNCLLMNKIINEKTFEIQGDSTVSSDHNGMQRSRQSILTSNLPKNFLFENFFIMLKCTGCQKLINNNELIELIKLTGAKYTTESYFSRMQTSLIRIVLCEKEYLINRKEIYDKGIHFGIHFLTPEWFVESLVQYRVQPFEDYRIKP